MVLVRWLAPDGTGLFLPERLPLDALVGGSILLLLLILVLVSVLARTLLRDWIP
jgi:hypothetical protein